MNWDYFSSARGIKLSKFLRAYKVKDTQGFKALMKSFGLSFTDKNLEEVSNALSEEEAKVEKSNEQSNRNKSRRPSTTQRKKHSGGSGTTRPRRTSTKKTTKHVSKSDDKQGSDKKVVQVKSDKD